MDNSSFKHATFCPSSVAELEEALAIEELAPAFKRSVNSQLRNLQQAA